MLYFRPFRNTDPPAITEIWRSQRPMRGLVQPVTPGMLETWVFSKTYFDRDGFILACDGEHPVGFVHGGFSPSQDRQRLSTETGVTCLLMVSPEVDQISVARDLLAHSERYLRGRGARRFLGGCSDPVTPFYWGLYGGSQLPGVLASDQTMRSALAAGYYQEAEHRLIFYRDLEGFRIPIEPDHLQIRRAHQVEITSEPPAANWWEANMRANLDCGRFHLLTKGASRQCGRCAFWDMSGLVSPGDDYSVGLLGLEIDPDLRRGGLATFLLNEALAHLHSQRVKHVEVQVQRDNAAAVGLVRKLGFQQVDEGVLYVKEE